MPELSSDDLPGKPGTCLVSAEALASGAALCETFPIAVGLADNRRRSPKQRDECGSDHNRPRRPYLPLALRHYACLRHTGFRNDRCPLSGPAYHLPLGLRDLPAAPRTVPALANLSLFQEHPTAAAGRHPDEVGSRLYRVGPRTASKRFHFHRSKRVLARANPPVAVQHLTLPEESSSEDGPVLAHQQTCTAEITSSARTRKVLSDALAVHAPWDNVVEREGLRGALVLQYTVDATPRASATLEAEEENSFRGDRHRLDCSQAEQKAKDAGSKFSV